MRVKQTELQSALDSCRQDQRRLLLLRKQLIRLQTSQGVWRSFLDQERHDQYQAEVHKLLASLQSWHTRLEAGQKELARLQLIIHRHLAKRVTVREDLVRSDELRARLLMLQGRLEFGEFAHLDANYFLLVQSVLECRLQVEQLSQHRFAEIGAAETTQVETRIDELDSLVNSYRAELLRVRRRSRHLHIILAQIERRRNSFTLEDVGHEFDRNRSAGRRTGAAAAT